MDTPQQLPAKPVNASIVREQVYMVFPNALNSNDTVFGGLIMAHMDRLAAVVADRHSGGVTVTVSVDAVHFMAPARRGDVLVMHAAVNRAWRSSMEVGVKVEAEAIGGSERRHILSAYFTFVAVDPADFDDKSERVNITLPRRILRRLDAMAQAAGESRAGFIAKLTLEARGAA